MANAKGNHEHHEQDPSQSTARRFAERLHEGVDRAAEQGERLGRRLHEGRENLDEEARRLNAGVLRMVRSNPWVAVGGSIVVGVLIGALFSRR